MAKIESVQESDDRQSVDRNLTVRVDNTSNKCETIKKEGKPQIERMHMTKTQENRREKRFSEQQDFKKEQGHFKVPRAYKNQALTCQVLRQRPQSKKVERGEETTLTIERREMLHNIKFKCDSRTKSEKLRWDEQFSELQNFRKEWGHCNVPTSYTKHKLLACWVIHQRTLFRRTQRMENSRLRTKNRKRLESIGFQWVFSREESENLRWDKHFSALQDFKQSGGFVMFQQDMLSIKISAWVQKQRHLFKCFKSGDKACFVVERRGKLESIGFQWILRNFQGRSIV